MAKTFTKTLKSQKSLSSTFEASKKICIDSKLDILENKLNNDGFIIKAKEPMKWLTTNWPNNVNIKGEIFNDSLMVKLETTSKGASATQDGNVNDFLSNIADSLNAYISSNNTTQHKETPSVNISNHQDTKYNQQAELDSSGIKANIDIASFAGERIISNDKYKLFLVDKYYIKKNEVLNQYVCDEKLFISVDDALAYAASIEEAKIKENMANELLRLKNEQERNEAAAEILRVDKKKAEEIELQKQIAWKAGAPKRRRIFIAILLVSSSSALWWYFTSQKEIHIKSNSIEFSGAKLGGKIKDYKFGDQLEIDGGPYFFTKNGALLSYQVDEKIDDKWKHASDGNITGITFECEDSVFGRSIGDASIDGFSCSSSTSELLSNGWKKLCSVYDFNSFAEPLKGLYLKNNAFFQDKPSKNSLPKISSFGLRPNLNSNSAYQECVSVEKLKIKAKKEGYKSLGDMITDESNQTSNNTKNISNRDLIYGDAETAMKLGRKYGLDETVIELENAMRSGDLKNIEATASKIWQSPLLPKDANLN